MEYSRELLRSLAQFTPVDALAFGRPEDRPPQVDHVTWRLVDQAEPPRWMSLASIHPNVAFRHVGRRFLDAAIDAARGAEAVFIDFIGLFWMVEPLRRAFQDWSDPPLIIVVNHNVEGDVRRQMVRAETSPMMKAVLGLDAWKAARLEIRANRVADGLVANTPADAKRFEQISDRPRVVIMPAYAGPRAAPRIIDATTPERICILGNREAHHKRMVLERTLQALSSTGVERRIAIDVVGAGDYSEVRLRYPGFNYVGHLDNLDDYLRTVRFGLIPDEIGGGFKVRALTHAFQNVPMLAVRAAVLGMGLTADQDYVEARDLADMARIIPELIGDFDRLNRVKDSAFAHCAANFDWDQRGRALDQFVRGWPRASA
jgi:hypothetical protein